jgi:hypothetical protein
MAGKVKKFFKKGKLPKEATVVTLPTKTKKLQFPSISRSIPEGILSQAIPLNLLMVSFLSGFLIMGIFVVILNIRTSWESLQQTRAAYAQKEAEVGKWETVTKKYPDYRDGYLKLAAINVSLGKKEEAKANLAQAQKIDPQVETSHFGNLK